MSLMIVGVLLWVAVELSLSISGGCGRTSAICSASVSGGLFRLWASGGAASVLSSVLTSVIDL
jgi:hypothetical protein